MLLCVPVMSLLCPLRAREEGRPSEGKPCHDLVYILGAFSRL